MKMTEHEKWIAIAIVPFVNAPVLLLSFFMGTPVYLNIALYFGFSIAMSLYIWLRF